MKRVLILGGRGFLGRHVIECLRNHNFQITLFNRSRTNPHLFKELECIVGDRRTDFNLFNNRSWEVVIDLCGYYPRDVRETAKALSDRANHYVFISSCSVYDASLKNGYLDESGPLVSLEIDETDNTGATYGARKYLCEKAIEQYFGDRLTVIRPGLIVGPFDSTYRFPYWVERISEGGRVLAPGEPAAPLQFIDGRDLAEWIVRLVEKTTYGVFNAVGPEDRSLTLGSFLNFAVKTLSPQARLEWVSEEFLKEEKVDWWTSLPLWVKEDNQDFLRRDSSKARAAGLTYRSIEETLLATRDWLLGSPPPNFQKSTISRQREREVLEAWGELQARLEKLNQEEIAIVPFDRQWSLEFFREQENLRSLLPSDVIRRIEHFGSTSIAGLSAKPIIDIIVEVSSLEETKNRVVPILQEHGYEYYWRPTINSAPPYYAWFIKRNRDGVRTHHIHMVEANSTLWERLYFRDYLREFPEEALRYEALKRNLSKTNSSDRTSYTVGKSEYVASVTEKAKEYYGANDSKT